MTAIPHQMCPSCGHSTVHTVAGKCTVFVPGRSEGTLAEYCGCDCYQEITGVSLMDEVRALIHQDREGQANGNA